MSDGFLEIVLFAMVAGFLVLRLRAVLGRRTGTERRRDPFARSADGTRGDNVVSLPDASKPVEAVNGTAPAGPVPLEQGVAAIRGADPSFAPEPFTQGARGAFELIVGAFAAGDTGALRPLLSDEVFEGFSQAIHERTQAKETHETNLVAIRSADLVEAALDGRTAFVTVRFVSSQVNVTRAHDNSIVDGDPDRVVEKTDFWTFARNTRSQDPNWQLVATRSG
jgi:predicted lipid-binding transport protein (Tim44 family)